MAVSMDSTDCDHSTPCYKWPRPGGISEHGHKFFDTPRTET